jgi:hypothetical protein
MGRESFERGMRGLYRLTDDIEVGAMGFVPDESAVSPGRTAGSPRVLFRRRG